MGPSESNEEALKRIRTLNQKLDGIRIPKSEFQDIPLKEALSRLRDASRQNDPQGTDPNKGICFVMKDFDRRGSAKPIPNVTLHLRNATVRDALKQLTSSSKLDIKVAPYAVELRP